MTPDTNNPDFLDQEAGGSAFRVREIGTPVPPPPRRKKTPRWLFVVLGLFGIMLVAGLVGFGGEDDATTPLTFFGRIKQLVLSGDKKLASENDEFTNVLLLGMGGPGHDGPYLTDTIILARLDLKLKRIALFSIPRDLLVNIPGHGWWRINNANAFGEEKTAGAGPDLLKQTIEQTLDIPVHYYVRIDFKGFEKVIDSLGGVSVDVDTAFTDTQYPADNSLFQTVHFDAGKQNMDGEEALIFARSRHGNNSEGSDFARGARQQKILMAVRSRILSPTLILNPARITGLYRSLDKSIATNMSNGEIIRLLDIVRGIDTSALTMHVFDDSPTGFLTAQILENGAYVLVPKNGYESLRVAIVNAFDDSTSARVLAAVTPTP
ncbi:MAG: LCP family protein, partial [bacterium]|nr:LCP family protein [bacterium]